MVHSPNVLLFCFYAIIFWTLFLSSSTVAKQFNDAIEILILLFVDVVIKCACSPAKWPFIISISSPICSRPYSIFTCPPKLQSSFILSISVVVNVQICPPIERYFISPLILKTSLLLLSAVRTKMYELKSGVSTHFLRSCHCLSCRWNGKKFSKLFSVSLRVNWLRFFA